MTPPIDGAETGGAAPTPPRPAPPARPGRRKIWRGVRRWLRRGGMAAVALAVGSVLWVAAYGLIAPPITPLMAWERHRLGAIERSWRPLAEISPHLVRAVIASEDAKFCRHWGLDLGEIRAALRSWRDGGRLRGASTLTQQTAKNLFLWPGRSWVRKGLELWFTGWMELLWSKRRIAETYLNVAEFGEGVFGAEAAARAAFGRPASALSIGQAARLAVVLPAPRSRDAARLPPDFARRLARVTVGAGDLAARGADACVLDGSAR